jgi:excisionase family DNA binding protein
MSAALQIPRERAPLDATPPIRPANDEQPTVADVLDVDDVAALLRIGRNTIYDLVGRNEIPHRRCGKQIRFSRTAVMRWLDSWSSQGAKEGQ